MRETKLAVSEIIEKRTKQVFQLFEGPILPIDQPIADRWGEMLAARDKHVDNTGLAATARVHDLVLITRNIRDLAGSGVPLVKPSRATPSSSATRPPPSAPTRQRAG